MALNAVPPECNYTLRRDTPNGPLLQTATLGQLIYHRWECGGNDGMKAESQASKWRCRTNCRDQRRLWAACARLCSVEWLERRLHNSRQQRVRAFVRIDGFANAIFRCSADASLLGEVAYADDRILAHVKSCKYHKASSLWNRDQMQQILNKSRQSNLKICDC